jgi:hypothetical protein
MLLRFRPFFGVLVLPTACGWGGPMHNMNDREFESSKVAERGKKGHFATFFFFSLVSRF